MSRALGSLHGDNDQFAGDPSRVTTQHAPCWAKVAGDLATRLRFAERHGGGDKRVMVFVNEGIVGSIAVNVPVYVNTTNGCEDEAPVEDAR